MVDMKENTRIKKNTSTDYIGYAFYAFGGLGMEILLMMVETNLYGQTSGSWSTMRHILHWIITCFIWGSIGVILVKQLPSLPKIQITKKNIIIAMSAISISIIYTTLVWKGLKPMIELSNLGILKFVVQYIYYAFESLLMMLIIAHGQKAFENWFTNVKYTPFGGILLAVTWGLIHVLTQGAATGIYTVIQALLYGGVYLALHKDFKVSYVVITLMFML